MSADQKFQRMQVAGFSRYNMLCNPWAFQSKLIIKILEHLTPSENGLRKPETTRYLAECKIPISINAQSSKTIFVLVLSNNNIQQVHLLSLLKVLIGNDFGGCATCYTICRLQAQDVYTNYFILWTRRCFEAACISPTTFREAVQLFQAMWLDSLNKIVLDINKPHITICF